MYERQRDPIILDVSWTEFALPMRDRGLSAVSTTHLRVKDNFYLGNPGKKQQVSTSNLFCCVSFTDAIHVLVQHLGLQVWRIGGAYP